MTSQEALDKDLAAARAEIERLRAVLRKLVRKGTDGRWYTTQHGDTDVTSIVGA